MKNAAAPLVALWLAVGGVWAEAGVRWMLVADVPYTRVWDATVKAVGGYPIERAADGLIATGWLERLPRDESDFERVTERVTLRVTASGARITRVTVEVETRGWRDGVWVGISDTEATERAILARVREGLG